MTIEVINPYVLKILIAAREKDSINAISERISLSYGWTYFWVRELAKKGVFKLTRMRLYLNKTNSFYKKTLKYIRSLLNKDIKFYYEVLELFGISYCFTQIDSVFIWTKGGYNIARYKNFYPIFIKVKNKDRELFKEYCKKLKLYIKKSQEKRTGVFYIATYLDDFNIGYCIGIPVDSLEDTISFMKNNKYNFEPALEMIKEMYGKKIKIKYKEIATNI